MKYKSIEIYILAFLFFVFLPQNSRAQIISTYNPEKKYSIDELKDDFTQYRNKLEKNFTNLYLYTSKTVLNHYFDSLYNSINEPMTDMEFYAFISQVVSVIKDGHNVIYPSQDATHYFNQKSNFFPYRVIRHENKLYVTHACTPDTMVEEGAELISINGLSTDFIYSELIKRQPRDGYNITYPEWILNSYFREFYSYVFGHPDTFEIQFKNHFNEIKTVKVDGLSKEKMSCFLGNPLYPEIEEKKGVNFAMDDKNELGYLSIRSFDRTNYIKYYHQNYKRVLRKSFRKIKQKNIDNLILDLRGNQGGNFDYGSILLTYLLEDEFQLITETAVIKHQTDTIKVKKGICLATNKHKPKKNSFKGKLIVLINGGCFSCCGIVTSHLERNKRATFIGTETGGNKSILSGNINGFESVFTLTHTKIHCDPVNHRVIIHPSIPNDGHGTYPSTAIIPNVSDYVKDIDIQYLKAIEIVNEK